MSGSWIPAREQDFVDLVGRWKVAISDSAKETAFGWDTAECGELLTKIGDFDDALAEYKLDKTPEKRLDKDEKREVLTTGMQDFAATSVRRNKKMSGADKLFMGIGPEDKTDTPQGTVSDAVDMTITNDPVADSSKHIIHYKKLGAANKAKDPWHLAIFQIYIQGPGESAPAIDDDAVWSKDFINMSSPFLCEHRSADAGKICWYRVRWEATNGKKGPWAMARAMIP
jgi:hypothetical protein